MFFFSCDSPHNPEVYKKLTSKQFRVFTCAGLTCISIHLTSLYVLLGHNNFYKMYALNPSQEKSKTKFTDQCITNKQKIHSMRNTTCQLCVPGVPSGELPVMPGIGDRKTKITREWNSFSVTTGWVDSLLGPQLIRNLSFYQVYFDFLKNKCISLFFTIRAHCVCGDYLILLFPIIFPSGQEEVIVWW